MFEKGTEGEKIGRKRKEKRGLGDGEGRVRGSEGGIVIKEEVTERKEMGKRKEGSENGKMEE